MVTVGSAAGVLSQAPVLEDRDFRAVGEDEIVRKEEELVAYKERWDRFQTDACYIEDDGEVW